MSEFDTKTKEGYADALLKLHGAISKIHMDEHSLSSLIVRSLENIGFTSHGMHEGGRYAHQRHSTKDIQTFIEHYHKLSTRYAGSGAGTWGESHVSYPKVWKEAIKNNNLIETIEKIGLNYNNPKTIKLTDTQKSDATESVSSVTELFDIGEGMWFIMFIVGIIIGYVAASVT